MIDKLVDIVSEYWWLIVLLVIALAFSCGISFSIIRLAAYLKILGIL